MPTIIVINGLKLCMYVDDHAPPHFHILGPDGHFLIELQSLAIVAGGKLPKSYVPVMTWAESHRQDLLAKWSELNERR